MFHYFNELLTINNINDAITADEYNKKRKYFIQKTLRNETDFIGRFDD